MKAVALAAGVSLGTVSRVINDNPTVASPIRARVLTAIKQLGYRPNAVAQSMRTTETKLIACLVSDISNPIYSAILRAAEERLSELGYILVIASSDNRTDREIALVDAFMRRRVDGLIGVFSDERDPELLRALKDSRLPLVLMEREMDVAADTIVTDHFKGTRDATETLVALGHKRIAIITGSQTTRSGRERIAGYRAALSAAGIRVDASLIRSESLTTAYAVSETQSLMQLRRPPTAIISGGNRMLVGVLRALRMMGRRIPQDVSVISSGETEVAELASPAITVIRWDLREFGRNAAELLLERIESPDAPARHIVSSTDLILRKSCGRAPA